MSILDHPRCDGWLKASRVNLNDQAMTDYWFAVILGEDAFSEDELKAVGICFDGKPQDGTVLLAKMESIFLNRPKPGTSGWLDNAGMDRLRAYFGSRGVKAGKLRAVDDFWKVAEILWPDHVKRSKLGLADLLRQISSLTKKQRQAASINISKVPAEFVSGSVVIEAA